MIVFSFKYRKEKRDFLIKHDNTCMQDHVNHEGAKLLVLCLSQVPQDVAVVVKHSSKLFYSNIGLT